MEGNKIMKIVTKILKVIFILIPLGLLILMLKALWLIPKHYMAWQTMLVEIFNYIVICFSVTISIGLFLSFVLVSEKRNKIAKIFSAIFIAVMVWAFISSLCPLTNITIPGAGIGGMYYDFYAFPFLISLVLLVLSLSIVLATEQKRWLKCLISASIGAVIIVPFSLLVAGAAFCQGGTTREMLLFLGAFNIAGAILGLIFFWEMSLAYKLLKNKGGLVKTFGFILAVLLGIILIVIVLSPLGVGGFFLNIFYLLLKLLKVPFAKIF